MAELGPYLSLDDFAQQVELKRQAVLQRLRNIPIAVLIWGPSASLPSPVADARTLLRIELRKRNVLATFSEDHYESTADISIIGQQLADIEAHDIVFSIPDSAGSIAEIHDFARIPVLSGKIIAFLDRRWCDGYSHATLIQLESTASCRVNLYDACHLPDCIINAAINIVQRLREIYYMAGRRW